MSKTKVNYLLPLVSTLLLSISTANAELVKPSYTKPLIFAYLGADSQWNLTPYQQKQMQDAFGPGQNHVDVINYAFLRFSQDEQNNTILSVSASDLANLQAIASINPKQAIVLSIGGWGARDQFGFLSNPQQRKVFEQSIIKAISQLRQQGFNIRGIDIDWENEQLAPQGEIDGLADLFIELRQLLPRPNYLITNAVPASPAYWIAYPDTSKWAEAVDYTTIMAYDHYGTFGPTAELGAALYDSHLDESNQYPYKVTSGHDAVLHYAQAGLPTQKIILGVPFYCHSYYISGQYQGHPVHAPVLDSNISSQVDYSQAIQKYGIQALTAFTEIGTQSGFSAPSHYALINTNANENGYLKDGVYRFLSCDTPDVMATKMNYIKGNNPLKNPLAGVSFWSLLQDVDYHDNHSLLRAINDGK